MLFIALNEFLFSSRESFKLSIFSIESEIGLKSSSLSTFNESVSILYISVGLKSFDNFGLLMLINKLRSSSYDSISSNPKRYLLTISIYVF